MFSAFTLTLRSRLVNVQHRQQLQLEQELPPSRRVQLIQFNMLNIEHRRSIIHRRPVGEFYILTHNL